MSPPDSWPGTEGKYLRTPGRKRATSQNRTADPDPEQEPSSDRRPFRLSGGVPESFPVLASQSTCVPDKTSPEQG
jgi:hypothetical protein